jgi:hypothetical protein
MTNRNELQEMLDRLDAEVAERLRETADRDAFWPVFAEASNEVLEAAGPEHFDWVSSRIDEMLGRYGISVPEA